MKRIVRRVAALTLGVLLGMAAWAGLETVTHISDLNASWPLGSDLASTSDDHIRNIKSALKTDFPNINGTWSSVLAPPFAPATDTNTGMYFPSADDLALATGGSKRLEIGSSGNVTVSAPGSGTAVTLNALSGGTALSLQTTAASASSLTFGASGQTGEVYGMGINGSSLFTIRDVTAAADRFAITAAGAIQGAGPVAGAFVDMTPDSSTFTGTLTGFTSNPTGTIRWYRIGKMAAIWTTAAITGTSNAGTMTMTGLPSAIQTSSAVSTTCTGGRDSGLSAGAEAVMWASVNGGTITFNLTTGSPIAYATAANNFTSSGTKGLASGFSCFYPIT